MATNQYLAFGVGFGANVLTPASYAASSLLAVGHQPGVALSEVANTTWRQTSVGVSAIAQMVNDLTGLDMLDDGNRTNFKNGVIAAIQRLVSDQQHWAPGDLKETLSMLVEPGWLLANGQVVSRTTYADLFAAIGTEYGAGDGATTFSLPDLRGEFLRGWDDGRGVDPGRTLGSVQLDALQNFTGAFGAIHGGGLTASGPFAANGAPAPHINAGIDGTQATWTFNLSAAPGVRTALETRPRNRAVRILIKT